MPDGGIALYCQLYPGSQEKQQRCLDLLQHSAREYYRSPQAKCTTWSYFTTLKPSVNQHEIGGLEVYTSKAALSAQTDDPVFFQKYHDIVKKEDLYEKPETLTAWYQAGGFLARDSAAMPYGRGVLVSASHLACKDRDKVLEHLVAFEGWVHGSEPGVLTYAIMTRPKAPNEILIVVRYNGGKAMNSHDQAPEHLAVGWVE